ncbi:MAG: hypothetical protein KJZ54_10005, partial [Phycisphaerales bacterium]|nr:hypothetical protein [Phycisphaerales bacterium]
MDTFTVILVVLVGAVVLLILVAMGKNEQARSAQAALATAPGFSASAAFVSSFNMNGIAVEQDSKRVLLSTASGTKLLQPNDIIGIELLEDNHSLLKTNRGSQLGGVVVGGLLLGGVGAVVGGLSGSKKSTARVSKLTLRITTTDFEAPNHDIVFFEWLDSGVERNSPLYQPRLKEAELWHGRLTQVLRAGSNGGEQQPTQTGTAASVADELEKLATAYPGTSSIAARMRLHG